MGLPARCTPEGFKKSMGAARSNDVKRMCSIYTAKVQNAVFTLLERNIPLSALSIKTMLLGEYDKVYTVSDMFKDILGKLRLRIDVDMTLNRYLKYKMVADMFMEMVGKERAADSLTHQDGEDYLRLIRQRYTDETSRGKLTILKTMLATARNMGKMKADIFEGIKPHFKKCEDIKYLTDEELKAVEEKVLDIERMSKIRDCFLFQCYSGLAFCDMVDLKKEDIKTDEQGRKYIIKTRQKTNVRFTILLLPKAVSILERYDYHLPVISNQRYNQYLKTLADVCGIKKNLTTHCGRYTAATQMLNHSISLDVVAKVLGHSSTAMTVRYAKLLDKTVLQEMSKMI